MSKKKNTLKDLDEFLKQQAASLVQPEKLNVKAEPKQPEPQEVKVEPAPEPVAQAEPVIAPALNPVPQQAEPSFRNVFEQLKALSRKSDKQVFREKLYDLLLAVIEAEQHQLPEDKIFINTLLYMKHGQNWKDAIREYWQNHE